ncbi:ABC transporter ATP-binding protein [Rhizobium sp. BK251]|uniref:ABC transporter ATP-binding protein n=1 Tax=Rhizobium sp. BK251 TaxID=2512125 RepID=UPI00104C925D|nr:ABC transporter ATP-binding protein [Rhizobium sp. BK251]TCL64154.1 carbohydrate ABC transporter ATP-binding protein (CUT1 family) [Rhizobium sp. BK251]
MPNLEIENVVKNYGSFHAIKGVSFKVEPGEFVVMVGPSGCGKSTLLRTIAGLETISGGSISIDGRDISRDEPSDRGVAMVFQNYALYPHMTVAQNMGFALKIAGRPKTEINAAVRRAAEILRITDHLHKKPKALSGGQKQRVAIGRAITRSPDVFLFDEPLSNLDAALRSQMRVELGRLHAELKATMVYVTHDQTEAMTMASRIVVLNDGRIEQVGSPLELYNRPLNRFVAGFLGSPRMNFIRARVTAASTGSATIVADGLHGSFDLDLTGVSANDEITLGVRPEAFGDSGQKGWTIDATVAVVESLGRETLMYVDAGALRAFDSESHEGYFAVHRPAQINAVYGDPISFTLDPAALFVFAKDGRSLRHPPVQRANH